ncbi:DUF6055 domain-containing protein [Olivibacter sp. XZL3]|uniref:DUF6055 domain-containing protein n=1 Tax=Olivibacter sp. XZL3 TaxID=1735116 RepID=UPI00106617BA|nr:DUF6055 domain-containing protein [Olivibacter sp. XZL3]
MKFFYLSPFVGLLFFCGKIDPPKKKELHIPAKIWRVPDHNNYHSDTSEYSYHRMVESENIAVFWAKEFGKDPMTNPDTNKRFDIQEAIKECERFYSYYVNELKFVEKGNSLTDRYKMLFFVIGGKEGTAFGGGTDNKIGTLWTPAVRMNKAPYGALAHELGHSFQYMVHADGAWGFTSAPKGSRGQAIFEMTSQFMLWQVYPEWMTFENYHLKDFLKNTHYAFLHEMNQYHSPYVLEYWASLHGKDFIGKLWRKAKEGEDPVRTYKRLTSIDQKQFNDEIFDAARRFITWDIKRIEKVAKPYANQHHTKLNAKGDGWQQIAPENCPQNYGYNGIELEVPASGSKINLQFRGTPTAKGFRSINPDKAGWRYGFLAVLKNGKRKYGTVYSAAEGNASFVVPKNTVHLWLVVSGAPTEHWEHVTDGKEENDEQWPYQIKLSGTRLKASVLD